jgi:hypothetical protein
MNRRCNAVAVVPDPSRELANYVRRQAAEDAIEQMALVLGNAAGREELDTQKLSARISRLPATSLYSELSLTDQPVTDQLLVDIVDEAFLPLVKPRTQAGSRPEAAVPKLAQPTRSRRA